MRRWLHCMIVALLCATLFMDTARACWHRRHHGRLPACPPAIHQSQPVARPAWTTTFAPVVILGDGCPAAWTAAPLAWHADVAMIVIDDRVVSPAGVDTWAGVDVVAADGLPPHCCVPCDGSAHVVLEHDSRIMHGEVFVAEGGGVGGVVELEVVESTGDVATAERMPGGRQDAVVVHEPTIVVATPPETDAAPSVVDAIPAPKTARPAAPQPQSAALEPLPDLKPAAAAEQPVPASLDLPAEPSADAPEEAMAEAALPAAPDVDDLAAAPQQATPEPPRERNLFDEYDESADEDASGMEDSAEPTDAETTPDMTEEQPAGSESSDEQPAEPMTDDESDAAAPAEDPAPAAEEAEANAMVVPDEPMRRWTDATGRHHAQGWLAELHAGDVVRILKVNGRYTVMAVADLSNADRAYVEAVTARLAGQRPSASTVNDTAGL